MSHRKEFAMSRWLLLFFITAIHLLALIWFVRAQSAVQASLKSGSTLVLIEPAAEVKRDNPAQRVRRRGSTPPPPIVTPSPQDADFEELPSPSNATGSCALAQEAGLAISSDPEAMAELDALPAGIRTDADAVMLWNGVWLDESAEPDPASAHPVANELRRIMQTIIRAASEECRQLAVTGPIFIPISQGQRTTTLVVGSGLWRWSDLLRVVDSCQAGASESCLNQRSMPQ